VGGGGGGAVRPPRAPESKELHIGRQNETLKIIVLCAQQILNNCAENKEIGIFLRIVISVRGGHFGYSPGHQTS
jgi:hypothetical protein